MLNSAPFEIIIINGARFRCEKPHHYWQYGLVEGEIDVTDKSVVEVYNVNEDGEHLIINTFTQVIMAGSVTDGTFLSMPLEKRSKKCPKCGFCESY